MGPFPAFLYASNEALLVLFHALRGHCELFTIARG